LPTETFSSLPRSCRAALSFTRRNAPAQRAAIGKPVIPGLTAKHFRRW